MRRSGLATVICSLVLTAGCQPAAAPAAATMPAAIDNPLLTELGREDQEQQMGARLARGNEERVALVLEQIGAGKVRTPADRFNAAIVLQHTPMTVRNDSIVATSPDNYLLGHHLAKAAFDAGYAPAKELVAQAIDRYLSLTTGIQKYGTNRFINQTTGKEELAPIDRATTDAERARFGIPPLATLLAQHPEAARAN
jgi:hypothetical protein